jgi:uncharacterized protein YbjT (DUF2867 family)
MTTVLVTGATGFIGGAAAFALAREDGKQLAGITRPAEL